MHPVGFTISKQHILQSAAALRIGYEVFNQDNHLSLCECSTTVIEVIVVLNHFMQLISICPSDIFIFIYETFDCCSPVEKLQTYFVICTTKCSYLNMHIVYLFSCHQML